MSDREILVKADWLRDLVDQRDELLAACKAVVQEKKLHGQVVDSSMQCREAIAKAEGKVEEDSGGHRSAFWWAVR